MSLCLTKHHVMKTYWGVEVYLHAFLISALDGGEWSASHSGRLTPRERAPGNTDLYYLKADRHNLKDSHYFHICNF
jgi:hypothetical protein